MASFRFLHSADIHLDSPLKGLTGQQGNAAEQIRIATREALENLISLAIEENVDFLIIAGDLYDGDWRDYNTGLFFARQMGRLNEKGIPVYLLHGNHDAESQITRRLELPANVSVFGSRKPDTFTQDRLNVVLHGQSYQQRDVSANLVDHYPAPRPSAFNIGVLHTGLGGMGGHANYAPCSLNELINKGYNYWALGHVHQAQVLNEQPHVVFPGNLQGRHIKETGAKGAFLVTVEADEIIDLTAAPCDVVRWAIVNVPLDGVDHFTGVIDCIRNTLESAIADHADGRLLACRIELEGRTDVHNQLLVSENQLLAEARAIALGMGDETVWVEKVVICTAPAGTVAGPSGEIQEILQKLDGDGKLLEEITSNIGELVRRLPYEVKTDSDNQLIQFAVDGDYTNLIEEVKPYLLARLNAQES